MYSALTVCSSNGHYFGVCSLPDCTEDVGPGLHAERFSVSVADGSLNYWGKEGTRKPKPQKETNKTGKKKKKEKEKGKVLVTSWKEKWWNSPSNTSAVKFYNTLIKEPWTCHQDHLKLLLGCSSLSQGWSTFWAEFTHGKLGSHRDWGTGDSVCLCVLCSPLPGAVWPAPCNGDFPPSTFLARNSVREGGGMEKTCK